MKRKQRLLLMIFTLLLLGCSQTKYEKQSSVFLYFKSAVFKHNDLAFLYQNAQSVKLEVYSNGQAATSLRVEKGQVCLSFLECMSSKKFNAYALHEAYPEETLFNLLRGRPIFSGENLSKSRNGFTQKIVKNGKYAIDYQVFNNEIAFFDKINKITVKIKRLE